MIVQPAGATMFRSSIDSCFEATLFINCLSVIISQSKWTVKTAEFCHNIYQLWKENRDILALACFYGPQLDYWLVCKPIWCRVNQLITTNSIVTRSKAIFHVTRWRVKLEPAIKKYQNSIWKQIGDIYVRKGFSVPMILFSDIFAGIPGRLQFGLFQNSIKRVNEVVLA